MKTWHRSFALTAVLAALTLGCSPPPAKTPEPRRTALPDGRGTEASSGTEVGAGSTASKADADRTRAAAGERRAATLPERAPAKTTTLAPKGGRLPAPKGGRLPPPTSGTQSVTLFAALKVISYPRLKRVIDSLRPQLKAAGVFMHSISRVVGSPNQILVHLLGRDAAKLRALLSDPVVDSAMRQPGLLSARPRLSFAADHERRIPPGPIKGATYSLFVRFPVANFPRWKQAFDGMRQQLVTTGGVLGYTISTNLAKPNQVMVHLAGRNATKLRALLNSKAIARAMTRAGVTSRPQAKLAVDLDYRRY